MEVSSERDIGSACVSSEGVELDIYEPTSILVGIISQTD